MLATRCIPLTALMLGAVSTSSLYGGNVRYVGQQASTRVSMNEVDHDIWDSLLTKYVTNNGRVNYRKWKSEASDTRRLDQYLSQLSQADSSVTATRGAQLAFWINAYNAVTVRGIIDEYPTTSIRNHTAKLWGYNIWKHLQLYVGGEPFSLDQIEHEILRKMAEPRIHFTIVCASIGCPRLLTRAYVADQIETQLESSARDFFERRQNFQHDTRQSRLLLSAILDWFGEDFGNDQAAVLRRIAPWLPTPAARQAAANNAAEVEFLEYDWNLNE